VDGVGRFRDREGVGGVRVGGGDDGRGGSGFEERPEVSVSVGSDGAADRDCATDGGRGGTGGGGGVAVSVFVGAWRAEVNVIERDLRNESDVSESFRRRDPAVDGDAKVGARVGVCARADEGAGELEEEDGNVDLDG